MGGGSSFWLLAVPVLVIAACGGDAFTAANGGDDASVDGANADAGGDASACVPKTCASLHFACGTTDDGCGKPLDCGQCHLTNFTCQSDHQCRCTPKTCAELGFNCGDIADGCGKTIHCGDCTVTGETCGGSGIDHKCGPGVCTPKTCGQIGAQCGTPSDGCGGILPCGHCPGANDVCDPNFKCSCVPNTCGQLGWVCGSGPDGCSGTLSCGSSCPMMETCNNMHQCVSQGCTPTTSCAQKGFTCGAIDNGCGIESCGSGPPTRNPVGDTVCTLHPGKPKFYGCSCPLPMLPMRVFGLDGGGAPDGGTSDGGNVPDAGGPPDSGPPPDSGVLSCGNGAPNPPVPGWSCDIVATSPLGGTSFCCSQ